MRWYYYNVSMIFSLFSRVRTFSAIASFEKRRAGELVRATREKETGAGEMVMATREKETGVQGSSRLRLQDPMMSQSGGMRRSELFTVKLLVNLEKFMDPLMGKMDRS